MCGPVHTRSTRLERVLELTVHALNHPICLGVVGGGGTVHHPKLAAEARPQGEVNWWPWSEVTHACMPKRATQCCTKAAVQEAASMVHTRTASTQWLLWSTMVKMNC